ncbi:MAG: polysaccharide deacetylase family protein [Firmicutes bacterium]|nr:polysaccharide deacetylase family protein [Bacillota bacterium]
MSEKEIKPRRHRIEEEVKCIIFVFAVIFCSLCIVRPIVQANIKGEEILAVSAAKKDLPIYCVDTPEKKVAISFDAAWGSSHTEELLSILKEKDVKATFFLCGYWIDKYPELVKKINDEGHTLGNHSNTHPHGSHLSLEENKNEIMTVHNKINELCGVTMQLYRPPFGEYNDTVLRAVRECGYYAIQWDIDSLDWKEYPANDEVKRVLSHKHLGNGSIILFHNDAKYTPDALVDIIDGLRGKGYEIVPIEELIYKDDFYIDHEGRQCRGSK